MPEDMTDEEREAEYQRQKQAAFRLFPCRICGTLYQDRREAKACQREHEWQNRKGRR